MSTQLPLRQSPTLLQVCPAAHLGQTGPPQSVSVSPPFLMPSTQVGLAGTQTLAAQAPLLQSEPTLQIHPFWHLPQAFPPQSTSVSVPFFTLSLQGALGTMQVLFWHWAKPPTSTQSVAAVQALPMAHLGQLAPPQSTSLSLPFLSPSLQVAATTAHTPPTQPALRQSVLPLQVLPLAHLPQVPPPLRGPVIGYVAVITLMVTLSGANRRPAPTPLRFHLPIAAVLFYVSDLCVALDRFVDPQARYWLLGLPLYYLAQVLFAFAANPPVVEDAP